MLWSEFASTLVQVEGRCTHFYEALLKLVAAEVEGEEVEDVVRRCVMVEHEVEHDVWAECGSMDVPLSRTFDVVSNMRVSGVSGSWRACLVVDGEEQWFDDLSAVTLLMALAMNQRVSVRVYFDTAAPTAAGWKLLYDGCVLSSTVRHAVQVEEKWQTATHEYGGGVMKRIDCRV